MIGFSAVSPSRYHPSLRFLHWLIASLVIAALFLGTFVMARLHNSDPAKTFTLLKHMAVGGLIFVLTVLRLVIRPKTRRPAPVYSGITLADRMVPYVHRIFDLLVLAMIVSGVAIALTCNLPAIVFLGDGALPPSFDALPAHSLHVIVARVLAGFVALHVVGALYHQFVLRDGLLARMTPALGRSR